MRKFAKFAGVLTLALLGSGCAGSMPTVTDATALCADWRAYRPIRGDKLTNDSAKALLENNEARKIWGCHPLEPRPA